MIRTGPPSLKLYNQDAPTDYSTKVALDSGSIG